MRILKHLALAALATGCLVSPVIAEPTPGSLLSFQVAARRGDMRVVNQLIEQGLDPRQQDHNGSSAAHYAARGGQAAVLRTLLDLGVPADQPDQQGHRPLYEAAVADSAECVRLLLEHGAELNATTVGDWNALRAALTWGRADAARALIEAGADLEDPQWNSSETPLMVASFRGPASVVKLLLDKGVRPNSVDSQGRSALHYAAQGGDSQIIHYLLKAGLEAEELDATGLSPLQLALIGGHEEASLVLMAVVTDASAALATAARYGSLEIVQGLLRKGVSEEALADAIVGAASRTEGERFSSTVPDKGALGLVELLLEAGASPQSPSGVEALCQASCLGNQQVAERLLDLGADPSGTVRGDCPLILAAENGHLELVKSLLARGASPQSVDELGRGPLERLDSRMAMLALSIQRFGRKRCLDPGEAADREQLARLQESRVLLSNLLDNLN